MLIKMDFPKTPCHFSLKLKPHRVLTYNNLDYAAFLPDLRTERAAIIPVLAAVSGSFPQAEDESIFTHQPNELHQWRVAESKESI